MILPGLENIQFITGVTANIRIELRRSFGLHFEEPRLRGENLAVISLRVDFTTRLKSLQSGKESS